MVSEVIGKTRILKTEHVFLNLIIRNQQIQQTDTFIQITHQIVRTGYMSWP